MAIIMPYHETYSKIIALCSLLSYAHTHAHSHLWVPAILRILEKGGHHA
jgi:hypothetical protein